EYDGRVEWQHRAHGKPRREPLAVMIEIRGNRWLCELGREHAETRVELVAAAVREHAELPRARHAGRAIARAQSVAHELALEVARGGAPAVGAQARGDRDEARDAIGMAHRERDA